MITAIRNRRFLVLVFLLILPPIWASGMVADNQSNRVWPDYLAGHHFPIVPVTGPRKTLRRVLPITIRVGIFSRYIVAGM